MDIKKLWDKVNSRTGVIVIVVALVLLLVAVNAMAHNHNPPPPPQENTTIINIDNGTDVTEITEHYSISDSTIAELVAKSAACDHSFYWGKEAKWMISPQAAYYDGEIEMCIGAAYRPQDTDVMFNLSVVPDEDTDQWLFQGGALIVLD